jgi:ribosome-associated heat shock protein Hsp15
LILNARARIRIDKWLWAARFYRTRSLAARAIEAGQVRVEDERIKASRAVATGERIVIRKDGVAWNVVVTAVTDRRGSGAEAAALYCETPASVASRVEEIARRKAGATTAPRPPGRPTKRDRRKLKAFVDGR